jgi:hypothetical protein
MTIGAPAKHEPKHWAVGFCLMVVWMLSVTSSLLYIAVVVMAP